MRRACRGVLIMEECEAMRINATPEAVGRVSVVRVTVEGSRSPINKR